MAPARAHQTRGQNENLPELTLKGDLSSWACRRKHPIKHAADRSALAHSSTYAASGRGTHALGLDLLQRGLPAGRQAHCVGA